MELALGFPIPALEDVRHGFLLDVAEFRADLD